MEEYILLGGGGLAIELYQFMNSDGKKIKGYLAIEEDSQLSKYIPWLGFEGDKHDDELDYDALYIIAVREINLRKKLIAFVEEHNLKVGCYLHSSVFLSNMVSLGKGAVAYPHAMFTGNSVIGDYFFIDCMAVVSHGDIIGNNVVVGPGVIIAGDCIIGNDVTFGMNSAVLPGTKIGNNVEIGINTYPRHKIPDNSMIITPPGKKLKKFIN